MPATMTRKRRGPLEKLNDEALAAVDTTIEESLPTRITVPKTEIKTGNTLDISASDKLRNECVGCRLRISRISNSRGFDTATKERIAKEMGITKARAVSGNHKIYDDSLPVLKEYTDLLSRVEKFWKSVTLPLASVYTEESSTEGGTRLIKRVDAEMFQRKLEAFKSEATTMEGKLNRERTNIIVAAREMLGPQRFNEANYPTTFSIGIYWGFPNVDVPTYMAQLAPNAYAHEQQLVAKRFEETYELATMTMLNEFQAVIESWVKVLGPVERIYPAETHPHINLHGAEILTKITNVDDTTVPDGAVKLQVRYKIEGNSGLQSVIIGPFTQEEYTELHVSAAVNEKRTFRDSTIENLTELVSKFSRLGPTISANEDFTKAVKAIENRLAGCRDAEHMAKELRSSDMVRAQTHELMVKLNKQVTAQMHTFTKTRRRVTVLKD